MPPPHPSARVRSPLALVLQPGLESSCVSELASCNSPFPFHQFGHILGSQSLHGFALSMTKNALQQALDGLVAAVQSNVQQFQGNLQRGLQQMQAHMARHLQSTSGPGPMLASITSRLAAGGLRVPQPLFELSFNPEELKFRLATVPVYTVVNNKDEFVLVSGEDGKQQLGLFFFKQEDAQALIDQIKSQNPGLAKTARVMATTMDNVYEFASAPGQPEVENVVFRFVPDAEQVEKALQLYHQAGVNAADFAGVPLFQAEGLTVKSETSRFTPLFFRKDDLDAALGTAYLAKDSELQADTRSKAERARAELKAAEAELAGASADNDRKAAQKKVEAASKRVDKYEARLEELASQKKVPRVDVGSLEEVIAKMELDDKGEWGDVMFIPPGALQADPPASKSSKSAKQAQQQQAGKQQKKQQKASKAK